MSALGPTLEAFFTERLIRQLEASPNTIAAYRDTMRLLLRFASEETGRAPSALEVGDLDAPLIGAFLDHLETVRGNGVRTRNARLAAIRSLLQFAALRHPEHAGSIERVLAIPTKRFRRNLVTFLDEEELAALLAAPDRSTRTGRRDRAMLTLTAQTGLRASELTGLRCADAQLALGQRSNRCKVPARWPSLSCTRSLGEARRSTPTRVARAGRAAAPQAGLPGPSVRLRAPGHAPVLGSSTDHLSKEAQDGKRQRRGDHREPHL